MTQIVEAAYNVQREMRDLYRKVAAMKDLSAGELGILSAIFRMNEVDSEEAKDAAAQRVKKEDCKPCEVTRDDGKTYGAMCVLYDGKEPIIRTTTTAAELNEACEKPIELTTMLKMKKVEKENTRHDKELKKIESDPYDKCVTIIRGSEFANYKDANGNALLKEGAEGKIVMSKVGPCDTVKIL